MRDIFVPVRNLSKVTIELRDKNKKVWAIVSPSGIRILKGYAWNGCSPKWAFFGRFFGTPDFEFTRLASCVHDVLFQFAHVDFLECDVWAANQVFYELMILHKDRPVKMAAIYKNAVDMAAPICYPKSPVDGAHSELVIL